MNMLPNFRVKLIAQLVMSATLAASASYAFAQDVVNLGTVQSTAESSTSTNQKSATYQAPTQSSLKVTQPTSIMNQHYIENNTTAAGNFSDIAQLAPSVWSVDPNGPGGMESQAGGPFLRGFQNGQYNVTFDGIPWGDSNDFTQHSTSYIMPQDLGGVSVDRGPGTASTIGWAPFGGTIASFSKNPSPTGFVMPYLTVGSWNTRLSGVELDTGLMPNFGNASMFIDYKAFSTDGYLTNSNQKRQNLFTKLVRPISDNTVLTFAAMQNYVKQNVPWGATDAQVQQYGYNYGLSSNPASQDFFGYTYDEIHSDMEYIGIDSKQGRWHINNKVYTDAYYHNGYNSMNGLDGTLANTGTPGSGLGTVYSATDVPGQHMNMNYRSIGDILRLKDKMNSGELDTGIWYDYQHNDRFEYNIDMTLGGAYNDPNGAIGSFTPANVSSVVANSPDRLMTDSLTTIQPYAQFAWKVNKRLTVTPGVKIMSFTRKLNAQINDHTNQPLNFSHTWTQAEPSVVAHYAFNKNWSGYAQFAKGFLAPKLQLFGKSLTTGTSPDPSSLSPEQTTNYQVGTTWASPKLALSADIYKIDFNNQIVVSYSTPSTTYYKNFGGTTYQGLEMEGTYYLGSGFSVYGNYSDNSAKDNSSNQQIDNAPKTTSALGVIYNKGPMYASLIAKTVGSRYSGASTTGVSDIQLPAYTIANLSASYTFHHVASWAKSAKVTFHVNNIADKHVAYAAAGTTDTGVNAWWWTPGRSYQVNVAFRF